MTDELRREHITDLAIALDIQVIFLDGHDDALLGLVDLGDGTTVVAYSTKLILEKLVKDGMSWDEAIEYFEFNIQGAYFGDSTPVYIQDHYYIDTEP